MFGVDILLRFDAGNLVVAGAIEIAVDRSVDGPGVLHLRYRVRTEG